MSTKVEWNRCDSNKSHKPTDTLLNEPPGLYLWPDCKIAGSRSRVYQNFARFLSKFRSILKSPPLDVLKVSLRELYSSLATLSKNQPSQPEARIILIVKDFCDNRWVSFL
jgi:hypothetical protein